MFWRRIGLELSPQLFALQAFLEAFAVLFAPAPLLELHRSVSDLHFSISEEIQWLRFLSPLAPVHFPYRFDSQFGIPNLPCPCYLSQTACLWPQNIQTSQMFQASRIRLIAPCTELESLHLSLVLPLLERMLALELHRRLPLFLLLQCNDPTSNPCFRKPPSEDYLISTHSRDADHRCLLRLRTRHCSELHTTPAQFDNRKPHSVVLYGAAMPLPLHLLPSFGSLEESHQHTKLVNVSPRLPRATGRKSHVSYQMKRG